MPWPKGVSGNPAGRPKRISILYQALAQSLAADFDGDLTGIEIELLWSAARMLARAERSPAKADDAVRLCNCAQRILAGLRSARRYRDAARPPPMPSALESLRLWSPMRERAGLVPTKEPAEP
jgi:hypothetical protein